MSGIHHFPADIQEQAHQTKDHAEDVHASFSAATSFQSISSNDFCQSRERTDRAKQCLDVLPDYLIHNIPFRKRLGSFTPDIFGGGGRRRLDNFN